MSRLVGCRVAKTGMSAGAPPPNIDMTDCWQEGVLVWRLPMEVSQSKIGDRQQPSNACTLIAISLAELLHRHSVSLPVPDTTMLTYCDRLVAGCQPASFEKAVQSSRRQALAAIENSNYRREEHQLDRPKVHYRIRRQCCSPGLLRALLNALLDGNAAHAAAVEAKGASTTELNFTIPDAIAACGSQMHELDFCSVRGPIDRFLPKYIRIAVSYRPMLSSPFLYLVMIAFERTVLLVVERKTRVITLVDSHMHLGDGSVLASAKLEYVDSFCNWLTDSIFPEAQFARVQEFELSMLQFVGSVRETDCNRPWASREMGRSTSSQVPAPVFKSKTKRHAAEHLAQPPMAKTPKLDANNNEMVDVVNVS